MAKAELMSIDKLAGKKFIIPTYQRGYRWEREQIRELAEDLYNFTVKNQNNDDYYCLQPIIVKRNKEENGWTVVDGQQRLTAL